jgi:hypothetical protein
VDEALTEDQEIAFNAGAHRELKRAVIIPGCVSPVRRSDAIGARGEAHPAAGYMALLKPCIAIAGCSDVRGNFSP